DYYCYSWDDNNGVF
nr:immunoglobulin light chain junction region [Macaca mulatta]